MQANWSFLQQELMLLLLKKLISEIGKNIHGMIHCSGGAQTKILHFVNNLHIIKDNLLEIPPLFKLIHEESGTDLKEMYKVFNMGHRLEVYLPKAFAESVIQVSQSFGIEAQIIGRVESSDDEKKLTIKGKYGEFLYR